MTTQPGYPPSGHAADPAPGRRAARTALPAAGVLAVWALLGSGIAWYEGEFTPVAVTLVLLGWAGLAVVVARGAGVRPVRPVEVAVAVGFAAVTSVVLRPERNMHAGDRIALLQVLFVLTCLAATAVACIPRLRGWPAGRWGVLALAAAVGVTTIVVVNDPDIDVWYLLQQSSDGLAEGRNMYAQTWARSDGLQDVYPYLPITTVLLAPFRWAFGDVRFGLLLALLATVVVAWRLGGGRREAAASGAGLVALLLVLQPKWPWLVDQAWTEPLLLLLLAGAVLAAERGHAVWGLVLLAVALACKQHVALLLPLFALWPAYGWRPALGSAGLAGLLVLPWVVASPSLFWDDAVNGNLDLPVIERALCLPALLLRVDVAPGFWLPLGGLALAYALVWWRVPRTASGLFLGSAFVLLTVAVLNKQSFYNHYTLAMGLLVLAVARAQPPETASSASYGTTSSSGSSSQPSGSATRF